MKTIGLIGGSTWVSTADYYRYINQLVYEKSGEKDYAKILLYSLNFSDLRKLSTGNNWQRIADMLGDIANRLETAGADCILLCANTLHQYANEVKKYIHIPLIHIAEETAKVVCSKNIKKAALLGTRYTMEKDFYKDILTRYDITVLIPDKDDREFIQHSIYNEFSKEIFLPETKARYIEIIDKLKQQGAEGVILGCTEIPLIIKQEDCKIPVIDTTMVHSNAAADFALKD